MLVSTNEIPLLKEQLDTPLSGFGGYLLDDEQTLHCLFWDFDHHIYHSIQTQEGFQFILQYRESSNAEAVLHSFLHQDNFNQLDETTLQKVSILLHGVDNIEEISQNMIMLKAVWLYIFIAKYYRENIRIREKYWKISAIFVYLSDI